MRKVPQTPASPIAHPSVARCAVFWPLPDEHPACGSLNSTVELAALIAQAARAAPASGPSSLLAVMRADYSNILLLPNKQAQFLRVLADPASHGCDTETWATAPGVLAFSNTISNLGVIISMGAFDEAVDRDHATREKLAGRAHVIEGGVIAGLDGAILYPRPEAAQSAGMLAIVVQIAAVLVSALARPPAPGWRPMRAPLQRDFPLLRAVIEAEQGFLAALAHPGHEPDITPPADTAPAVAALCEAMARLAVSLMERAAVDAVRRDHAVRQLLAGRAWVAPDGSIIEAPRHAA